DQSVGWASQGAERPGSCISLARRCTFVVLPVCGGGGWRVDPAPVLVSLRGGAGAGASASGCQLGDDASSPHVYELHRGGSRASLMHENHRSTRTGCTASWLHLNQLAASPLCAHGLDALSSTGSFSGSPLDPHGLHYSQLLRVGSSQIVPAPTRAAHVL